MFSVPTLLGAEPAAVAAAIAAGEVAANGSHTREAEELITQRVGRTAMMTSSCTDALLIAVMALELNPGDEVIVPSFTFVSTALVVALRGATPVFADIEQDTLTLDPRSFHDHLTDRTRAVIPVHYAGASGDLDAVLALSVERELAVIEDAAHAYGGTYRGRPFGTLGDLGALSFHSQKNLQCGEGGAVLVADAELATRVRVLREKGTNRQAFIDGEVDKYTWVGLGGHHLPPDYVAAALVPQLIAFDEIQNRRALLWERYADGLTSWADAVGVITPTLRAEVRQTHHIYWLVLPTPDDRRDFTRWMAKAGIPTPFHYPSLARSPAGARYGRTLGTPVSDRVAQSLIRLPLHHALSDDDLSFVIDRATAWRPVRRKEQS